jgi:hypothetical protein
LPFPGFADAACGLPQMRRPCFFLSEREHLEEHAAECEAAITTLLLGNDNFPSIYRSSTQEVRGTASECTSIQLAMMPCRGVHLWSVRSCYRRVHQYSTVLRECQRCPPHPPPTHTSTLASSFTPIVRTAPPPPAVAVTLQIDATLRDACLVAPEPDFGTLPDPKQEEGRQAECKALLGGLVTHGEYAATRFFVQFARGYGLRMLRDVHAVPRVRVNVNVNELRLGFSNTTRNPEGIQSHNNRKSCVWSILVAHSILALHPCTVSPLHRAQCACLEHFLWHTQRSHCARAPRQRAGYWGHRDGRVMSPFFSWTVPSSCSHVLLFPPLSYLRHTQTRFADPMLAKIVELLGELRVALAALSEPVTCHAARAPQSQTWLRCGRASSASPQPLTSRPQPVAPWALK